MLDCRKTEYTDTATKEVLQNYEAIFPRSGHANYLKESDVLPFQDAIKQEVDVIMTAHVTLKDESLPVSLSEKHLNQYLRSELNFKGIILSDDMEMNAVLKEFGLKKAILQTFNAGTDIMMVAGQKKNQKAAFNALLTSIQEGKISEERLNQSVKRILRIKLMRAQSQVPDRIPSSDFKKNIALKALTPLQTSITFEDFSKKIDPKLLVITPYYSVYKEVAHKYSKSQFLYLKDSLNQSSRNTMVHKVMSMKNRFDVALIAFRDSSHVSFINDLVQKNVAPIFALSLSTPYFKVSLGKVDSYVCIYDHHEEAIESYLSYLSGELSVPLSQ